MFQSEPRVGLRPAVTADAGANQLDLICLSHLRWDFVFQRPQQLMTRFARDRRVLFVEEPFFDAPDGSDRIDLRTITPTLMIAVPHLSTSTVAQCRDDVVQQHLIDEAIARSGLGQFVLWYWTPMALPVARHLAPALVVFDCMDELSHFAGAPPQLLALESELLQSADVVFTGGQSLYEAKVDRHHNIHPFPSSVDAAHFTRARQSAVEPLDQRDIPRPRIGFFGVIDERMDLALVEGVARQRPDWHWVLIGPTAKIDPDSLPRAANIHYLGMKTYEQLPDYLAGWDVAALPFARNAATRFISPTKTPEYLAAGCPVVSTSIRDVIRPYGDAGLVHIADDVAGFVAAMEAAASENRELRLARVDALLAASSWNAVVDKMNRLLTAAARRSARQLSSLPETQTAGSGSTHSPASGARVSLQ
jgi:UDP-galactopyranose mutase